MSRFSEFEDGAICSRLICSGDKPEKLVIDVKDQETVYNLAKVIFLHFFAEDGDCCIRGAEIACMVYCLRYNYPESSRVTDCTYEFKLEDIYDFDDVLSAVARAVTI